MIIIITIFAPTLIRTPNLTNTDTIEGRYGQLSRVESQLLVTEQAQWFRYFMVALLR